MYVFQPSMGGFGACMVPLESGSAGTALPFTGKICMGLGWQYSSKIGRKLDLDASILAFDSNNKNIGLVSCTHPDELDGSVKHLGDSMSSKDKKDEDNEVMEIDLGRVPPNVYRLAFMVNCYSKRKISNCSSCTCRVFLGDTTLAVQKLYYVVDDIGCLYNMLQRNPNGSWFLYTAVEPAHGQSSFECVEQVEEILSKIPPP